MRSCVSRREMLLLAGGALGAVVCRSGFAQAPDGRLVDLLREFAQRTCTNPPPWKVAPPGVSAALVLEDGAVLTGVAGWADPVRHLPVVPATRFMSGSTGKTFCAATALCLVEHGKLTLDARLEPLFADEPWFARLPNAHRLTLRALLMHAAGFPQFLNLPAFMARYAWDSTRGREVNYSPRQMLGFILDTEPVAAFGTEHNYSDLHYHVVGLAIEKVTGGSYYEALQRLVLARLPGTDVIPATHKDLPTLAAGYARGDLIDALAGMTGRVVDAAGVLRKSPVLEYTGGGLALTPRSLAAFYSALVAGRIVSLPLVAEMQRSSLPIVTAPGLKSWYGLGVYITEREGFGRYLSHSGFYPGYTSNVGYFLDHRFAAALQMNADHGPDVNDALRQLARAVIDQRRSE